MAGLAYDSTYTGPLPVYPSPIPADRAPPITWTAPASRELYAMTASALAAAPADQAVLVIMADAGSLATLMNTTAFRSLLTQGRTLFATPAVGDSLVLTGETAVATLSVAAKPSA